MNKNIYSLMQNTLDNVLYTENGMQGYRTTKHPLTDVNFAVSSFRDKTEDEKISAIESILMSGDAAYALRFMMYVRDIHNGLGERDLVKTWLKTLINFNFDNKDAIMSDIITKYIPKYGRYDDLFVFLDTAYDEVLINFIKAQLKEDYNNFLTGKSISLLAKWMPSINTSSKKTRELANNIVSKLGAKPREYRKLLSLLRRKLDVVEVKTSANNWNEINYNAVPSKANLKYKDAFLKHDEERRREYLSNLQSGVSGVKMNGGVNFPHDIIHSYEKVLRVSGYNETLEQLWKNLKQMPGLTNTIVVRDGSGSMCSYLGSTSVRALDVSTALSIYCAEKLSGNLKDKFLTFSSHTEVVDLTDCKSLAAKLEVVYDYDDCTNTNIEDVFDKLLLTAKEYQLSPEEMPSNILIISDMEFDEGVRGVNSNVFLNAATNYKNAGYELPKLIFWNVASHTNTIPCKENKNGVILMSGFSQNTLNLVSSGKTDPFSALVEELDTKYSTVPLLTLTTKETESKVEKTNLNFKLKFLD